MSEKPQTAREEGQDDLLEQIITQGLEKIKTPAQASDAEDAAEPADSVAPPEESGKGGASPPDQKRRSSAVYLYLLVLFGAAFMLLLLAYFVQQRSSENTISGLRDSMNLSRQELLAQIAGLEEENDELRELIDLWQNNSNRWQDRYDEEVQTANLLYQQYALAQEDLYSWDTFWTLEQFYQIENYEACAAILLLQQQGQYTFHPPNGADRRYEEIVQAVIAAGILDEDYLLHPEDYQALLNAYSTP